MENNEKKEKEPENIYVLAKKLAEFIGSIDEKRKKNHNE